MRTRRAKAHVAPLRSACQPPSPLAAKRGAQITFAILLAIILLAAALRIPYLTSAPPGLNQDEAANAWNAWCLLKTGTDQFGAPWPIFYFRALGENRTTLFLYFLLPFEALGGLNVWTARLPSAVGGVLTILLIYWIVARMFNRETGLIAAALLALSPWHITLTRLGHEAAVCPLLTAVSFASLLWAGFPLTDSATQPSPWRALVAGLCIGVSCYGYPSVRLFLPVFMVACVLIALPSWWRLAHTRRGLTALFALAVGVGATFGPLAYQHLAHPEGISRHANIAGFALWEDSDSMRIRAAKVASRYVGHFYPDFLFINGDRGAREWADGFGVLSWYAAPLLVIGILTALRRLRDSRVARLALCWLLLYPVGDILYHSTPFTGEDGRTHESMHFLRSAPGLPAFVLLAALGAAVAGRFLWRRNRWAALMAAAALGIGVLVFDGRFLRYFFTEQPRRSAMPRGFHVDLQDAMVWLKPRMQRADAVFVTSRGMNMPYILALVALDYDPQQWFRDDKQMYTAGEWDHFTRVGKFYYMYGPSAAPVIQSLQQNGRSDHVYFIVRPGELPFSNPVYTVRSPAGQPALLVYETEL